MPLRPHKAALEALYDRYTRPEFIDPDPLVFLHDYPNVQDREIVALVASSLAYGRVAQICKSVARVLERMGEPARFLERSSRESLDATFADFKHRFTTGPELAALLYGAKRVIERDGALGACFAASLSASDETVQPALAAFVDTIEQLAGREFGHLLPSPVRGSACKRLNLFVRWMVRRDDVDLGGWDAALAAKLVVPLDTHMHRIGLAFGLTKRRQTDWRTAIEITDAFRKIAPEDPVRYDFALTRLGIRADADIDAFLRACGRTDRQHHA